MRSPLTNALLALRSARPSLDVGPSHVLRRAKLVLALASTIALSACSKVDQWWAAVHSSDSTDASLIEEPNVDDTDASTHPAAHPPRSHDGGHHRNHADGGVAAQDAPSSESNSSDAGSAQDGAVAYNGPTMTAMWVWVPVFERMEWDGPKVGYLRAGAQVPLVSAQSTGNGSGCPRGWYAVEGGGYMCLNRMTTLDPHDLEGRRPAQPDLSQPYPYTYMTSYRAATMYRWLPSAADMREVEPERFGIVRDAGASMGVASAPSGTGALLSTGINTGINAINTMDGGRSNGSTAPIVANRAQAEDAGVRIEDLQGEQGSPMLRRMLAGMYISVDREMASAGRRFWRTQNGGFVERGVVSLLRNPPNFQGVTLDEAHSLPMAFMVAFEGYTFDLSPDGRRVVRREQAPRLTSYHLTSDPPVTVGHDNYLKTSGGFYLRERNIRQVHITPPPAEVTADEKWVEVNLDRQMLIAYVGPRPVYVTLISSGRRNRDNEERNYETVQGGFRIQSKHIATTMDGNSAGDGPYSIEDVPWVMYFENSFALHGAFWHNTFGYMRSHGCVNMAPADARWVFQWSEPQLPAGWHGVNSNDRTRPGTRVYVHYERQPLGERGGPRVVPQH